MEGGMGDSGGGGGLSRLLPVIVGRAEEQRGCGLEATASAHYNN